MSTAEKKGILLESGTSEMEIVEFSIGKSFFGINVIKVREIISILEIVQLPGTHPCIEGLIQLRGNVMPVIDLAKFLGYEPSDNPQDDRIIVTEFNQMKLAFRVHTVTRIHRIRWEQIEKPSDLSHSSQSSIVGIVKMEGKIILLLDFERIVMEINPGLGFNADKLELLDKKDRSQKRIMIVEDSATLRSFLEKVLSKAGYRQLTFYENGTLAWEFLEQLAEEKNEELGKDIQLIITDIEMPQMDGHQLTRKIKEHPLLKALPVVIFSSLISEDLKHKGEAVGANAQISKPDFMYLAQTMDNLVL